ncbi:nucleoside triphosphate pyrophosphohydrolase family protein [Bacillus cereus group sp. MYBK163-2]|uniref:nucleoside triphosphate pyrophosphohydrolase family protein n=1 Tax=Bacillus cereus group TaxID=86661 RepID=UPI000B4B7ECB|nr:nucleoside triphosphate pyrophosphohydrolase family protein [Bacillus cereus]MDA2257896.1 nucleoside triphosphate pyrophosphohydrolase family protein [Bacillus cereus]MDA2341519.1 nucleoside triphosphate pyrophosphohydrolase family protein [Bacillus cereus]MDA2347031.1 nucleoside triphosphate pyrophosphohydrolase family protein [Bacillus cereus]MDA2352111.1 nucleoside triphosphate pyrophosphohydrolase family protein [Bacillus cereus]MEC2713489.1 nucleoside triphosphate pyrophosphohydrolase 
MNAMENGVYEITRLVSESMEGQAVMNINQICELDQYQEATLRTWNTNNDFGRVVLNAALGLTGEAGEVADVVKKAIFHGHGFDPAYCPGEEEGNTHKIALEIGDIMYYISIMSHERGYTLGDIAQMNISKLATRYPDGFSGEAS